MVFYLGSQEPMPIIKFELDSPAFNTQKLSDDESAVIRHFTFSNVIYIGSHEGCGCAFRHALWEQNNWMPLFEEDIDIAAAAQQNHQALYDYLTSTGEKHPFEIYGCWDGDFDKPEEYTEVIGVEMLLNKDFYFKERGYYSITHDE